MLLLKPVVYSRMLTYSFVRPNIAPTEFFSIRKVSFKVQ